MSGRQRAVPEKEYKRWEQEVVNKFYTESQAHTELVPTDGHPSIVQKEKVIAVVLAGDGGMIDQVAREEIDELPRKGGHIMLYHIGKDEKDGVSYGYIEEKKEFVHPGIDVGGLTNYRQPIGKSANFIPDADAHFVIGPHCDAESAGMLGSQLRETWNKYAPKPLPQDFNTKLSEVVRSIHDVFQDNGGAVLKFWKPPSEHRVLVTSADVRARTGKYYERVFGKGLYAMESDGIGLFAGVSKSSITPNINRRNIDLEYIPYAPAPPTCTTSSSSRCVPTSRRRPCRCWAAATAALPVLVGAALASGIQRFKSMDEHRRSQALDSLYKWSLRVGADRLDGSVLREGPGLDVDVPPTLVGKSAVITGGTKGCGFHAAVNFKALGADVVISGRSEAKAGDAARKIAELGGRRPGAAAGPHRVVRPEESYGSVVGLPLDTTVFETVRRFACLVVRAVPSPSIDFLILNAGTSHSDADQEACVAQGYPRCLKPALGRACPAKCRDDTEWVAKSGHNRVMAGNHLGHFLLASMLAPHLAPDASVVVVSSLAMWFGNPHWLMQHWGSPPQRLETVKEEIKGGGDLRRSRVGVRMYATSKLANYLFALSLRERLEQLGAKVVAMTPGNVDTEMARRANAFDPSISVEAHEGGRSVFLSAFVAKERATDFVYPYWFPEWLFASEAGPDGLLERSARRGFFFRPERLQKASYGLHASIGPRFDEGLRDDLWDWSRRAVGLPAHPGPLWRQPRLDPSAVPPEPPAWRGWPGPEAAGGPPHVEAGRGPAAGGLPQQGKGRGPAAGAPPQQGPSSSAPPSSPSPSPSAAAAAAASAPGSSRAGKGRGPAATGA